MEMIGIRDLKNNLSRHLKRVRAGKRLVIGDRGKPIATINPVEKRADTEWIDALVAAGDVEWSGGKPAGVRRPIRLRHGPPVSDAVIEDRR